MSYGLLVDQTLCYIKCDELTASGEQNKQMLIRLNSIICF